MLNLILQMGRQRPSEAIVKSNTREKPRSKPSSLLSEPKPPYLSDCTLCHDSCVRGAQQGSHFTHETEHRGGTHPWDPRPVSGELGRGTQVEPEPATAPIIPTIPKRSRFRNEKMWTESDTLRPRSGKQESDQDYLSPSVSITTQLLLHPRNWGFQCPDVWEVGHACPTAHMGNQRRRQKTHLCPHLLQPIHLHFPWKIDLRAIHIVPSSICSHTQQTLLPTECQTFCAGYELYFHVR